MDSYTIEHKGSFFRLFTDFDLSFKEVRGILDYLLNENAFDMGLNDYEEGRLYSVILENYVYDVDVYGYELIIYKRTLIEEKGRY